MPASGSLPPDVRTAGRDSGGGLSSGALCAILGLFVVSGASGLVYEVAWTRRLLLVLGSTSTASAVVLSAFLGGLGLGAHFGGRRADRSARPLVLYGVLELVAAAWAFAFPHLLDAISTPYVGLAAGAPSGVRFALRVLVAVVVVVPGAAAVGATFPALLAAAVRGGRAPGPLGALLYGVNTLGAVAGALWAGFSGIFTLGVTGATRVAALAAAVAGLVAIFLARASTPAPTTPGPSPAARIPRGALFLAAASGFVALGLEASGVRILVFFIEGFTPSFAAMLGVFLAGMAVGSLVLGNALTRRAAAGGVGGVLLALSGVVILAELSILPHMESWLREVRRSAYAGADLLAGQRWTALVGSAAFFLAPAMLLGATFPVAVRWAAGSAPEAAGRAAGRVYLASSFGSFLGPVAVLCLGRLSAEGDAPGGPLFAWALLGATAVLLGAGLVAKSAERWVGRAAAAVAAVGFIAFLGWPALRDASPEALVRASHILRQGRGQNDVARRLVAVRADDTTTASVVESSLFERGLYTDDFQAAATGQSYPYMRLLGHLPVVASARPHNIMVIAFGTGTTAGAVATHREVRRIEIAETSRAVVSLANFFEGANGNVLGKDDPRVTLHLDDGRNALLLHAPDLDVITLEPLLPYTPAALPFYTREFYELARDRLRDGGVLAQWVPVHAMPVDIYAALLKTFFETFPGGSLWFFEQSTILLGHKGTALPDPGASLERAHDVAGSLAEAGLSGGEALAAGFVASGKRVLASLAANTLPGKYASRTVTDDDPFPEAHPSPRAAFVTSYLADTLHWLASLAAPDDEGEAAPETRMLAADRRRGVRLAMESGLLGRAEEAAGDYFAATGDLRSAVERLSNASDAFDRALPGLPAEDQTLRSHAFGARRRRATFAARIALAEAGTARASGDSSAAASALENARALAKRAYESPGRDSTPGGRPAAILVHVEALILSGRCDEAEDVLARARTEIPWNSAIPAYLSAVLSRRSGRALDDGASDEIRRVFAGAPPCAGAGLASIKSSIDEFIAALGDGAAVPARIKAEFLLARAGAGGAAPEEIAKAIRGTPVPGDPALAAERGAVLRSLAPKDDELSLMLGSDDSPRWHAALSAAAHYRFERLALTDRLARTMLDPADSARLLAFCSAALEDGGSWSRDRLADLLGSADVAVRTEAYAKLRVSIPEAMRADLPFDATGPDEARAEGQRKLRAWLATRK